MKLVDANVLINAVNTGSPAHAEAKGWLDRALSGAATVAFAWNPLLAFVHITTSSRVFETPLRHDQAMDVLRSWTSQPGTRVLQPTPRHAEVLGGLLHSANTGGNLVNDAHIAALAIEHRATVVSYDSDFVRFPGVRWEHPATA